MYLIGIFTVERTFAHQSIGIERLPHSLRAVAIELKDNQIFVDDCFDIPLKTGQPDEEGIKQIYIAEGNKKFDYWLENDLVISALSGEFVLVRPMEIKLTKQKEIDQVLYFQAEPLLPFPVEEGIVDRIIVDKEKEGTQMTLLAAPTEQVQKHLNDLSALHIDPEIVTAEQAALSAYLETVTSAQEKGDRPSRILICLEKGHTTCILNKKGKLATAQTIPLGFESLNSTPPDETPSHEVDPSPLVLKQEIIRMVYALGKHLKGEELAGIVITGEGANIGTLAEDLISALQKPILPVNLFQGISKEKQNVYATAIGAALTGLPHYNAQINFRQKEASYKHPLKRFKKGLFVYVALALALAIAAFFAGQEYVGYREDKIRESYAELLANIKRPYEVMEAKYAKKEPLKTTETPNLKELSIPDLTKRLDFLEGEVKSAPTLFPLFPNVPRVSDLLAWLASHPNVVLSQPNNTKTGLIQIDSLSYVMVKRPEMNKKGEKYQVKVELELLANTPKEAREFHDALISPNEMVDPKAEVKWNATKGHYRTSFFLKDRTHYPQLQ